MKRIYNRDSVIATIVILFCALSFYETFNIRIMPFAGVDSRLWPRLVISSITILAVIYFIQSLVRLRINDQHDNTNKSYGDWIEKYSNSIWSFGLFAIFIISIPYLGMLISGILFVFGILTATGSRKFRDLMLHAAISAVTVGSAWVLFVFFLGVILPQGRLLPF